MKKNLITIALLCVGFSSMAQTPRLSLYELFTGETCPPCAYANPQVSALLALPTNSVKCVAIKWQVPIPTAPTATWSLYQTNKTEIDWRWPQSGYGYTIYGAPEARMDGRLVTVFGAPSNNPFDLTSPVIATAQSYTSAFSVTMDREWDATGASINLTVNIQATANFNSVGSLVFRTVMVEREIHFPVQPGTNGEKDFEDVAIRSFPTLTAGISMASNWTTGQTQTFTLNCLIPSYTRKKSEIAFVGFIQDDGNRRVAQAVRCDKQTPTNDAAAISAKVNETCSSGITPQITIANSGLTPITAMTIVPYIDGVAGTPFNWTGNLAVAANTLITLNLNSPVTPGVHVFSYNITSVSNIDFEPNNNTLQVSYLVANAPQATPVAEGFEAVTFPPVGFTAVNPDAGLASWSRFSLGGGFGLTAYSVKYDFYHNTLIGDQDEFVLPPANLNGSTDPVLMFDLAYTQRNSSSNDLLEVLVSDNCGATWANVFSKAGAVLTPVGEVSADYIPNQYDPSHWRTETVTLTGYNQPNVLVKFRTTNDHGNNLFLDNINLKQNNPSVGIRENTGGSIAVTLFPNPAEEVVTIGITATGNNATVRVVNTLGQLVYSKQQALNTGASTLQVEVGDFAPGIYSVVVESESGMQVKKLMVDPR